ncbi:toxin [Chitinophaga sp. XS-30]|nr:toxin [Chitinophaga sp. XS-30]
MLKEQHTRRMRVFAGPNGSGKSTIIKEIQKRYKTGVYINADDIEKSAREKGFVNLGDYGLEATPDSFNTYLQHSTLFAKARQEGYQIDLTFSDNVIRIMESTNSYEAALIADYLRNLLIGKMETFSFETVMSHSSKLETFRKAHEAGFKIYLYYIATESPDISVRRVEERVKKGGHPVPPEKIVERYVRSLELLSDMIPYCHRCFIFDNSLDTGYRLILDVEDGERVTVQTEDAIPMWTDIYLLQKLGI